MKVLIIEDEREIIESVTTFLENEQILIETACTLREAFEKVNLYEYDCVVLDLCLPDGNGLEVIREMKQCSSDTGIIILSALDSLEDRLAGLNLGADDYLTKPFHLPELYARINSIIRRRQLQGHTDCVFQEIVIKPGLRQVFVNDSEITLTRKEYDLLYYFFINRERVLSKESIVEHLWGDFMGTEADSLDIVYSHLRNLRRKIAAAGAPDYIRNVYGIGYKFTEY
ncbi:MAG: response regulator transcription factor [Bacteroidales bacterium]